LRKVCICCLRFDGCGAILVLIKVIRTFRSLFVASEPQNELLNKRYGKTSDDNEASDGGC